MDWAPLLHILIRVEGQVDEDAGGDDAADVGQDVRPTAERDAGEQVESAQQQRQPGDADGPQTHPLLHRRPRGTNSGDERVSESVPELYWTGGASQRVGREEHAVFAGRDRHLRYFGRIPP